MSASKLINSRKYRIGSTHDIVSHIKRIGKRYKAITWRGSNS